MPTGRGICDRFREGNHDISKSIPFKYDSIPTIQAFNSIGPFMKFLSRIIGIVIPIITAMMSLIILSYHKYVSFIASLCLPKKCIWLQISNLFMCTSIHTTWNLFVLHFGASQPSQRRPKLHWKHRSFGFQVCIHIRIINIYNVFHVANADSSSNFGPPHPPSSNLLVQQQALEIPITLPAKRAGVALGPPRIYSWFMSAFGDKLYFEYNILRKVLSFLICKYKYEGVLYHKLMLRPSSINQCKSEK